MALIIPSPSASALRALTSEQLHRGSGTINFIRQLGGSCGITALVFVLAVIPAWNLGKARRRPVALETAIQRKDAK